MSTINFLYWIPLICMASLYIYAGVNHFRKAWFFYKITPPILQPYKKSINTLVGMAEILGGIGLLIADTRSIAAWCIIALLIAVFPANIYMLQTKGAGMKIPISFLWLRLPMQLVLIWWAYQYT